MPLQFGWLLNSMIATFKCAITVSTDLVFMHLNKWYGLVRNKQVKKNWFSICCAYVAWTMSRIIQWYPVDSSHYKIATGLELCTEQCQPKYFRPYSHLWNFNRTPDSTPVHNSASYLAPNCLEMAQQPFSISTTNSMKLQNTKMNIQLKALCTNPSFVNGKIVFGLVLSRKIFSWPFAIFVCHRYIANISGWIVELQTVLKCMYRYRIWKSKRL